MYVMDSVRDGLSIYSFEENDLQASEQCTCTGHCVHDKIYEDECLTYTNTEGHGIRKANGLEVGIRGPSGFFFA